MHPAVLTFDTRVNMVVSLEITMALLYSVFGPFEGLEVVMLLFAGVMHGVRPSVELLHHVMDVVVRHCLEEGDGLADYQQRDW